MTRRTALRDLVLGLPSACWETKLFAQARSQVPGAARAKTLAPIRLVNAAQSAGVNFRLENSPTPLKHLIETMAGGVAAFDYNGDGLADIFFTNGAALPSLRKESPKYWNRLFRNEGGMRFKDVTEEAGVAGEGFSMGAAVGDYDNDGNPDLFVAGVNHNILYHNLGNGRFEDVTEKAGIKSGKWAVAGAWFDYNNDGLLDLFVVNYAHWSIDENRFCGDSTRNIRVYCHPMYFEGLQNTLYRNRGDGTFEDVTEQSGVGKHQGRGMGVAVADYDGDGFMDVFVTNDNQANFLFHNRGNGTFEEVGLEAGVALMNTGQAVSSMGVDFRDYDNDGRPDIFVSDLNNETFPLFRNLGGGLFEDASLASRIARLSASRGGWSAAIVDLNNDGWKDLVSTNSHADDNVELFSAFHYRQPNSIFANLGDGTFWDVSGDAGADFQVPRAHRGCAIADFDNDGRLDMVVSSLQEPAELWHNVSPGDNHWIILKFVGTKSNRDGIGAHVRVGNQHNHMTTALAYASSSHYGVHFGLGKVAKIEEIEIRWPSGIVQKLRDVAANQKLEVHEPAK